MASTRWTTGKPMGTGTVASCHHVTAPPTAHRFNLGLVQRYLRIRGSGEFDAVRSKGLAGGGSG